MASDPRRRRLVAWALALLVFALGATAGVALDRLALREAPQGPRTGPPAPEVIVERMRRDLALSDAQARAVSDIVEARWQKLGALFSRVDPEAEAIRSDADARIRALLEPEQRARFDAEVAERARRRAAVRERLGRAVGAPGAE